MAQLKKYLDLRFDYRDDKAQTYLGGMKGRIEMLFSGIPNDIGTQVGMEMRMGILDNFKTQSSPKTGMWAPLTPRYKRWKDKYFPGEPIGKRTHQLHESISYEVRNASVIAGVFPGGGSRRNFKAPTQIAALFAGETKKRDYKGLPSLPPAETYAGSFNAHRDFLTIPQQRRYNINRTVWFWVVQGKVRTSDFGSELQ